MFIKIDNTNDENIFKIHVEEAELQNNYHPEDDIGRSISFVLIRLNILKNMQIFKPDSFYMTDSFNIDIIEKLDKNRFLCIYTDEYDVNINFRVKSHNLINSIVNSLETVSFAFNSFLLIAELEDNIYKIENNKILNLQELDINENNCQSLFDYCIDSSYYDLAFLILNNFYKNIIFNEKQIKIVINSNHITLIDLYFSKSNYLNIFLFIKENNIINSIINIIDSNFFKKNSSDIIHFLKENKKVCSQELILLLNFYDNIKNF